MIRTTKVDARSYYDTLPPLANQCGDIWRDLPTFGIFGSTSCAGIVITPACDLSWQKSDTITYLPIIPLRSYFSLDAALPLVFEKLLSSFSQTGWENPPDWKNDSYLIPSYEKLEDVEGELDRFMLRQQRNDKVKHAAKRAKAGLKILRSIKDQDLSEAPSSELFCLFGSDWIKIKEKMIRNNFSPATHFLPKDLQDEVFSGVVSHSLVLFRYPITIPFRILGVAQSAQSGDWGRQLNNMNLPRELIASFPGEPPLKLLSLKPAFLSDLLTRFSALYNRIGSPDFSKETTMTYINEVDA